MLHWCRSKKIMCMMTRFYHNSDNNLVVCSYPSSNNTNTKLTYDALENERYSPLISNYLCIWTLQGTNRTFLSVTLLFTPFFFISLLLYVSCVIWFRWVMLNYVCCHFIFSTHSRLSFINNKSKSFHIKIIN